MDRYTHLGDDDQRSALASLPPIDDGGDEALQATGRARQYSRDVVSGGGWQRHELGSRTGLWLVDVRTVERQGVDVEVQVHGRAKTLQECDGSAMPGANPALGPVPAAPPGSSRGLP